MNPRATIALLVVTLLVVGALFYLRRHAEPTREAVERERYAAVFEPEEITGIDIVRGAETVSLRRTATGWRLAAPVEDRASPELVDRLLMTLRFLEVRDRENIDPAAVPESGLSAPRVRIDLRTEQGADWRFDLGADAVVPGQIFARVGGERALLRVPATVLEPASAPADKFRDPRLTELVAGDIEKFTVRRADGEMTVRRERGRWMVDKPVQAPADPRAVDGFLEGLLGLRIDSFPAGGAATAAIPGDSAGISLTPRAGGEDLELQVTRPADPQATTTAALFRPRGGAITVDVAADVLFAVTPEALRDKSLGQVDPDTVDRIQINTAGREIVFRREADHWLSENGGKVTAEQMTALIDTFNKTRIVSFRTADTETGLEGEPSGSVRFFSWLSENTAEEPAGGNLLAGVEFGASTDDGEVFARAGGSREIVTIPAELPEAVKEMSEPASR